MAEPIVGATTGCVAAVPGYFKAVREVCDRHGALLILDEVMCGMGRTGTMHAWEQEGITPDIQIVGKGLGGGYQPIGGILIARRIIEAFAPAPAPSCTATPTRPIPSPAPPRSPCKRSSARTTSSRTSTPGRAADDGTTERLGNHRHVGDIRGRGLFQAIELVADRATKAMFDPALKLNERIKRPPSRAAWRSTRWAAPWTAKRRPIARPTLYGEAVRHRAVVERLGDAVDDAIAGLPKSS